MALVCQATSSQHVYFYASGSVVFNMLAFTVHINFR